MLSCPMLWGCAALREQSAIKCWALQLSSAPLWFDALRTAAASPHAAPAAGLLLHAPTLHATCSLRRSWLQANLLRSHAPWHPPWLAQSKPAPREKSSFKMAGSGLHFTA
jgi:hypothetical protein